MFSVSLFSIVILLAATITGQRIDQEEDPRDVQIIKQINRVNEDGTYTYGYEAADGSFKIETRDVLGNVKGMFGYVDNNGELKRVSYSAANGTGFQASDDYGPIPSREVSTRRPFLLLRGSTAHQIQKIPPKRRVATTPVYEYATCRSFVQELATEAQQRPPVRVLVSKRPLGSLDADSREQDRAERNNVIRRQLGARDNQDVFSAGNGARAIPLPRDYRFRPQIERPDQRENYRNMLLEQNNLKPDYPPQTARYYPSVAEEQDEQDYPEVSAVVPMVNRVLGGAPNSRARPRYARPPPSPVAESAYPVLPYPNGGGRGQYRGSQPPPIPRVPPLYDQYSPPIDYEALREEIMNYLIQYIQYRTRGYYNRPYAGYPEPAGQLPGDGYYQPRAPAYQPDYYNQRYYGGRIGSPPPGIGGLPPPLPPGGPQQIGSPPPFGQQSFPPFAGGYGPVGLGGYNSPAGPAGSYPFVNPNVQYASSEDASGTTTASPTTQASQASETLSSFKKRMDASDHQDASDTRPPSPGLIRMLLARPGTARTQLARPTVRSVEILGTAASENRVSSTTPPSVSSTSAEADPMIATP